MWHKVILVMIAVLFLLAAGSPVSAYDPRTRIPRTQPSNDEHPWGDENYTNTQPIMGVDQVSVISERYFLITISVQNAWDNAIDKAREIFGLYESQPKETSVSETKSLRFYNSRKPVTMRKR
ncbi:MAG: hypothetical protein V3V99_04995 [candidate division Zixibacteria bacterium]